MIAIIPRRLKEKQPCLLIEMKFTCEAADAVFQLERIPLTLSGSAGNPVRLQDVSFSAAAAVWPVGVLAGLAARTVRGAFIMILWEKKKTEERHL